MSVPYETGYYPAELFIPCPDNPRKPKPTDPDIIELGTRLATVWYNPVQARPHPDQPGKFDLRAGHRRLAAATAAGIGVRADLYNWTDEEALEATLDENAYRKDLSPLEEAALCALALERFGGSVADAADKLDHSAKWIRRRASLARLAPEVREAGQASGWGISHYEIFAVLPEDGQRELLGSWPANLGDGCTACELRKQATNRLHILDAAHTPWPLNLEIIPTAPPCNRCPKRSTSVPFLPGLFDDEEQPDQAAAVEAIPDPRKGKGE